MGQAYEEAPLIALINCQICTRNCQDVHDNNIVIKPTFPPGITGNVHNHVNCIHQSKCSKSLASRGKWIQVCILQWSESVTITNYTTNNRCLPLRTFTVSCYCLPLLQQLAAMHLSMSCPTYPKSGQVGDMVGSWYQDFVPRGGDFVSPLYLSYYSLQCNYCE